ncbi:MAG: phage late control D family protein [Kofleriaceae bacterium]|nr:phage late control D family protein [Myxococcales bacterium]MCB9563785.1 phage late control D family protein [Kofleriaceae bacterium]MCB9572652.1 phage late control D family protein [Kofleriaceae bacterium]
MTGSARRLVQPGAEAYAPAIRVSVGGRALSDAVLQDVQELRVTLQRDELAGFSIVLANVDPGKGGLSRAQEVTAFKYSDSTLLDVGGSIVVEMGYAGQLRTMLVGDITTLSPSFPESGLPTIAITGVDGLGRLRRFKPGDGTPKQYLRKQDWQIAQEIASRHGLQLEATREGPEHPIVQQKDQDDLEFLLQRAKVVGFDCYVGTRGDGRTPTLFFIRPKDGRDGRPVEVLTYRWGESLRAFTPRLTVGRLVSKVTVRGWDPATKQPIKYTAALEDLPRTGGKGRTGLEIVDKLGAKEERIVDQVALTQAAARELAIGLLERTANEFLTGTGEAMGNPELRPGVLVRLEGLGTRFRGDYTVTKAEHVFGSGGYSSSFDVERMREEEQPR